MSALILLSVTREIKTEEDWLTHGSKWLKAEIKGNVESYMLSMLFHTWCGILYAIYTGFSKHAHFEYQMSEIEFSTISGVIGSFLLWITGILMNPHADFFEVPDISREIPIIFFVALWSISGFISNWIALVKGSVHMTQVLVDICMLWQMVWEAMFIGVFPNLLQKFVMN